MGDDVESANLLMYPIIMKGAEQIMRIVRLSTRQLIKGKSTVKKAPTM